MKNKLPKMADKMVERVYIKASLDIPRDVEASVLGAIMRFHTGKAGWPATMPSSEIPNHAEAMKAQDNATRNVTLVYDIDIDGNWEFIGVQ